MCELTLVGFAASRLNSATVACKFLVALAVEVAEFISLIMKGGSAVTK